MTALEGTSRHWTTNGATAIHDVREDSFRVYVRKSGVTPDEAEQYDWRITWRAEIQKSDSMGTSTDACVGTDNDWRQYGSEDLYMDVDTSGCLLAPASRDPLAFFSIQGRNHSVLDGLTSVYSPTENKFRIYVSKSSAITPGSAADNGWKVNWHIRD